MFSFFKGRPKRSANPENCERYRYCPTCHEEYRPEFANCAACGRKLELREQIEDDVSAIEKLVDREGRLQTDADIADEQNLVAASRGSLLELKRLKRLLAGKGIPALLAKDPGDCSQGCCGGPSLVLMVRGIDKTAVRSVLERDYQRLTNLAGHTVDSDGMAEEPPEGHRCPACNSLLSLDTSVCPDCGLCL